MKMNMQGIPKEVQAALKKYRITITIRTPTVEITNSFDRVDFETPQEWVKAAKAWIGKDEP